MNLAELGQQPKPPEPTEKAQIVIVFDGAQQHLVMRYGSVKRGEKEHKKLIRALEVWMNPVDAAERIRLHGIAGEQYSSNVDLARILAVSFIDHKVMSKFIPR